MNGKDLSRQLSGLPEEMIADAMAPAKPLRHRNIAWRALRLAACFAIVLSITLLFPVFGNTSSDFFYIRVYANETENVELRPDGKRFAASNVVSSNTDCGAPFNSVLSDGVKDQEPIFWVEILFHENANKHNSVDVLCNGKNIDVYSLDSKITLGVVGTQDSAWFTGYFLAGTVEHISVLQIILYDEEGAILQRNSMLIVPVAEGYRVILC